MSGDFLKCGRVARFIFSDERFKEGLVATLLHAASFQGAVANIQSFAFIDHVIFDRGMLDAAPDGLTDGVTPPGFVAKPGYSLFGGIGFRAAGRRHSMPLCEAGEGFHGLWVVRVLPTEALRFVRAALCESHKSVVVAGKPCIASTDRFSCIT
jgi:hypothetical protein